MVADSVVVVEVEESQLPSTACLGATRYITLFLSTTSPPMDSTPASLFDSFDQDFQHIVQSIKAKLDGEVKTQQGGVFLSSSPAAQPS